jgi:molybdopterin/thiamine biosynthesis adenylyltransferase/rhodanese-related sulfurtransferase
MSTGNLLAGRELQELSHQEIARYSRHLILSEIGMEGQKRLKAARALCIGAGGLGSPVAMYLAAAGVGTLGIVDFDLVDFSNLQRQILHSTPDVGRSKLLSAKSRLNALNPDVNVVLHDAALDSTNAIGILQDYDVIVDGTDNFPTRYLVNDACVILGKPTAYGAIFRFEGQASVFATAGGPCYRCLYPEPPPPGLVPTCAEAGVLGVLPGIIGTIQATETLKLILGIGETLAGRLIILDALRMKFRELKLKKDPECPVCGEHPTIRELIDYEEFCGLKRKDDAPAAPPPDFHIAPEELKRRLASGDDLTLVDVREPQEYDIVRLPGAILMPLGELERRLSELDPSRELVVYCHKGIRSVRAVAYMRHVGLSRARNLVGGIDEWTDKVDPSLPRY